jgi:hypothetical protein
MRDALCILSLCTVATVLGASVHATPVFHAEAPTVILSTDDMNHLGLLFPDGTLGFVRRPGTGDPYYILGAGGRLGGAGGDARLPPGSYAFTGTLDSLKAVSGPSGRPDFKLTVGSRQPSPDSADFDRDYAGGGPTYVLPAAGGPRTVGSVCGAGKSPSDGVWLQIYHGEFRLQPPQGLPAYGGSGMAVSCDGGATFNKIGQILSPHVSRQEFLAANRASGLWADGGMVEANSRGIHSCPTSICNDHSGQYFYLVFTDHNSTAERFTGLSLARVPAPDLLGALREGRAPSFRKYFNPAGTLDFDADHFTEPALGGRSTPVLFTVGQHMNTPGVIYDTALQQYVVFYQANQKQLVLRTSKDLLNWSDPEVTYQVDADSERHVYYPSLTGDGQDPQMAGRNLYLFFLVRDTTGHGFHNPQLLRQKITVMP